ncbi:MAG TPA: glutathione peroxidase [Cytophagaceae bacterium]|jgi:glutathione peroxidase|nr:glutathione peroxidase [Cytophagaceae bacterium]
MRKKSDKGGKRLSNKQQIKPPVSFFELKATANNGKEISMDTFKGKKIMVVNVASNCGYTNQYEALEKLYKENESKLVILGFPANDFNDQETGTDKEIEQFCKVNFGVTFPLFKKHSVLAPNQNEIYQWLTDEKKNGWNQQVPVWNFSKYILNEEGILENFYGPAIAPDSEEIKKSLS